MYKKLKMYNALQYHNCNFIVFCIKHHIVTIILYLSAFIVPFSFFSKWDFGLSCSLCALSAVPRGQGSGCAVAAVGFPDAAAQGANEAVHGVRFVCQLIPWYQTLDIPTVPHDPATHRQQHQQSSRIQQQITKVATPDLKRDEDADQKSRHTEKIHKHRKHQDKLTVGQSDTVRCRHGERPSVARREALGRDLIWLIHRYTNSQAYSLPEVY